VFAKDTTGITIIKPDSIDMDTIWSSVKTEDRKKMLETIYTDYHQTHDKKLQWGDYGDKFVKIRNEKRLAELTNDSTSKALKTLPNYKDIFVEFDIVIFFNSNDYDEKNRILNISLMPFNSDIFVASCEMCGNPSYRRTNTFSNEYLGMNIPSWTLLLSFGKFTIPIKNISFEDAEKLHVNKETIAVNLHQQTISQSTETYAPCPIAGYAGKGYFKLSGGSPSISYNHRKSIIDVFFAGPGGNVFSPNAEYDWHIVAFKACQSDGTEVLRMIVPSWKSKESDLLGKSTQCGDQ
jgi:hypothetical protein